MEYEKLDPDFKKKWINALRSGKYKQGDGNLYKFDNNSFCCLGVACVVSGEPLERLDHVELIGPEMFTSTTIPEILKSDYLPSESPIKVLVDMNDGTNLYKGNKQSFEQIADWIEQNL